ncbi:MAG TPA: fumarate hydratase [Victivallales bacterium]|nr:fumarate hydratase [Victivallales bacterium]
MKKISNKKSGIENSIYRLIADTSCSLPDDVEEALRSALRTEKSGSIAKIQLSIMLENAKIAKLKRLPICQDTGTLYFVVDCGDLKARIKISDAILKSVMRATEEGLLRSNTVCPLSGKSYAGNISENSPLIEFIDSGLGKNSAEISFLMKGGGSENISSQYSLPDECIGAERDLNGIQRAVLDSVFKAQGKGCPPGAVAVCVGGDRTSGYIEAKKLFFKKIGQRNNDAKIAKLERELLHQINNLGIGPQGLGGKTFALDVFVKILPRHPASFFVTVSQMCWAWRRNKISVKI